MGVAFFGAEARNSLRVYYTCYRPSLWLCTFLNTLQDGSFNSRVLWGHTRSNESVQNTISRVPF